MMAATKNTKAFYNTEIPSDWEVSHFEDVADIDKESLNGSTPKDYEFDYISLSDVDSDDFQIETTRQVFASAPSRARRIVRQGDILMSTVRPNLQGFSLIRNEVKNLIASTGFAVITAKKCTNEYLFQYLFSSGIERQFYQLLVGSNYPAINSSDVRKLKIPLPPLPEQKAIAQVLSTADASIHTTEKLIAQKELRKKWLMQQLLTGKKRLNGFGGEWKEYHLGSLGETYTGLTGKIKDDFGEGKPYIPYLNIFNNARIDVSNFDFVKITVSDNQNKVKYGDIFFTVSSETPDEVGMASVMLDEIEELYLNSFCFGFRLYDFNILVPEFSSYFLRADAFRTEIYKLSQGATRFNLSKNKLMKLNIVLPPKDEQTAIAQVLQAADKEISLLKAKAEKLREQKKGLMQQLLSGKKRIKV